MRIHLLLVIIFFGIKSVNAFQNMVMQSPKKQVSAKLFSENGQLKYSVSAGKTIIIEPSVLGLKVDDYNFGTKVSKIKLIKKSLINDEYLVKNGAIHLNNLNKLAKGVYLVSFEINQQLKRFKIIKN